MAGFARIPLKLYFIEKLLYKTHEINLAVFRKQFSEISLSTISSGEVEGNKTLASIARLVHENHW